MVRTVHILYLYTNLKRISLFVQKIFKGSQSFEIGSRDPGHAHLGVVSWSVIRFQDVKIVFANNFFVESRGKNYLKSAQRDAKPARWL